MKKIILKIIGMHCTGCAMNIDGELEDTQGVKSAKTNYAKHESEVEFDEKKVQINKLLQAVDKAGYQAQIKAK